jgi:hypothetical protein
MFYHPSLMLRPSLKQHRRELEMQNKNCKRQAEMGIGDCAGLPEEDLKVGGLFRTGTRPTMMMPRFFVRASA